MHAAWLNVANLLRYQDADRMMATLMHVFRHTRKVTAAGPLQMQLRKSDVSCQ